MAAARGRLSAAGRSATEAGRYGSNAQSAGACVQPARAKGARINSIRAGRVRRGWVLPLSRMMRWLPLLCLAGMATAFAQTGPVTDIQALRLWRAPDNTRLVFDLTAPVEHRIFTLQNPDRLVIDISRARLRTD